MSAAAKSDSVFVSRFNRVLAVVVWILDAAIVAGSIAAVGGGAAWAHLVPGALVAVFAFAALWAPRVEVDDDKATLVNVLRTIEVPWEALVNVDTRFSLKLITPNGSYSAWAAPAPGRTTTFRLTRARRGSTAGSTGARDVRPGDLLDTDSGDAAHLVRDRWTTLIEEGRVETGIADTVRARIRLHPATIGALAVLGAATVVVLALG